MPALVALVIWVNLLIAPWHEFSTALIVLVLLACLMVGFAEELIFRGYLLVGARTRWSEGGAWFVTSLLFSLLHGVNILLGQSVQDTTPQIISAFILGSAFYLIRRLTGLLIVGMTLHGLRLPTMVSPPALIPAWLGAPSRACSNTASASARHAKGDARLGVHVADLGPNRSTLHDTVTIPL